MAKGKAKSGQILVLMAMLSTTLIIMFGMVVSVGHLVEAKINLQNSVDLAAMSGASWQARFLNHISLVNYRMRQNYKFTLYDLYVTQSRFNRGWQTAVNSEQGNKFARIPKSQAAFGICQQTRGYCPSAAAGETGECTGPDTDMCSRVIGAGRQGQAIPPIIPSPIPSLNPTVIAINLAIENLSRQATRVCNASGGQNLAYFNYVMSQFDVRQRFQMQQLLNVIDEFRIAFNTQDSSLGVGRAEQSIRQTFEENLIGANKNPTAKLVYLNPPQTRAIVLDQSFRVDSIFNAAPPGGGFSDYFERMTVKFKSLYVEFQGREFGACNVTVQEKEFLGTRSATDSDPNGPGVLIGLSRKRTSSNERDVAIPFNITLKATVKPNLLFWPRGLTPTLVAVGAAKPFGSRIAPPAEFSNLEVSGVRNSGASALANMSFYPGDLESGDAFIPGIGHKVVLRALRDSLPAPDSGVNAFRPSIFAPPNLDCDLPQLNFMCFALAPTLYEGFFWNVFSFPIKTALTPSLRSVFPIEFPVQVSDQNAYLLGDRMDPARSPSDEELSRWHFSPVIGDRPLFQDLSGKPIFFANSVSALSSWSPDVLDFNNFKTSRDTNDQVQGRMGYQIKLSSIKQICGDILKGGVVDLDTLGPYCGNGGLDVFY